MSNYLETKICEISDDDFQLLVDEVCQSVRFYAPDFQQHRFSFLLMEIARRKKTMSMDNLVTSSILDQKVGKLPLGSAVRDLCVGLVVLKKSHIDKFSGKSVFTLIKTCHKSTVPKTKKTRPLGSYSN